MPGLNSEKMDRRFHLRCGIFKLRSSASPDFKVRAGKYDDAKYEFKDAGEKILLAMD